MVPLLGGVYVDEQGAHEGSENQDVGLEAEIAAVTEKSNDCEYKSEGAPGDGDPGPMAFVVGKNDDKNGSGGGIQLRGFDGSARGFEAEPAGAEIQEGDDERKGDETKREAGVEIRSCEEGIDIRSEEERGEREEVRVVGEILLRKGADDD